MVKPAVNPQIAIQDFVCLIHPAIASYDTDGLKQAQGEIGSESDAHNHIEVN